MKLVTLKFRVPQAQNLTNLVPGFGAALEVFWQPSLNEGAVYVNFKMKYSLLQLNSAKIPITLEQESDTTLGQRLTKTRQLKIGKLS